MQLPQRHLQQPLFHDHNKAVDVSWNPAEQRVLQGKAAPDATTSEKESLERMPEFLSMIPVLGSWILTERLLCVHSSHIFANKQAEVTPVLAAGQSASRAQSRRSKSLVYSA